MSRYSQIPARKFPQNPDFSDYRLLTTLSRRDAKPSQLSVQFRMLLRRQVIIAMELNRLMLTIYIMTVLRRDVKALRQVSIATKICRDGIQYFNVAHLHPDSCVTRHKRIASVKRTCWTDHSFPDLSHSETS
jgi:hypothetical protein